MQTAEQETERGGLITAAEAAERRLAEREPTPPAEQDRGAALMRMMERTQDPELIGKMLDLYQRWEQGENRKAYIDALARAQETMPVVAKNAHVFFEGKGGRADTDYWHADYGNLVKTVKPHLSREGLSYDHNVRQEDARIYVTCILSHGAGHEKSVTLSAPPDDTGGKNPIQQVKSTVTYLKRATLELVSGAATEDDDDDGRGYDGQAVELIGEEEVAEIESALAELGADRAGFLSYLSKRAKREILDVVDIPAAAMLAARQAIAAKRKKMAEDVAAAAEAEEQRDMDFERAG